MSVKILTNAQGQAIIDDGKAILVEEGGGGSSTKYGATADNFLGNVNSDGLLQQPSGLSTNLEFNGVRNIGQDVLYRKFGRNDYMFYNGNQTIVSASFPDLTSVSNSGACYEAFFGCSNLASLSFPLLANVTGYRAFYQAFYNCTALTSVNFYALSNMSGSSVFEGAFHGCSNLLSLNFPSLNVNSFGQYTNQFDDMLSGCQGVEVHFPYTLETLLGGWASVKNGFSGTNTQVLYDLGAGTIIFNTVNNIPTYLSYKTYTKTNKGQYTNYNKQGNPVINLDTGDVSGFDYNNYLYLDVTPTGDTETIVCFTTPTSFDNDQVLFYGSGEAEIIIDSLGYVACSETDYGGALSTNSLYPDALSTNTKYWFKILDNGNSITGYLSTDGINYTEGYSYSSSMTGGTPNFGNTIGYGNHGAGFNGTIHLADCIINYDNQVYWDPYTPGENTFTTFYVGSLPYIAYFPNSNLVDYESVNNIIEDETRTVSVTQPQSSVVLTISITNDPVNQITLICGNIEIPVTKSNGVYTINVANGSGNTIGYRVARTQTTAETTGTITLTGATQSETITLTPLPSSNITLVGSPVLNTSTGELSSLDYENYATSTYTLPTDEFEFITKVKVSYDSSSWMTGSGSAFEFPSNNRLCYWEIMDPWNQKFGAYLSDCGELTGGVMFDGMDIYVFFKYIQSGTTVELYCATDWNNEWTKDTVPSDQWTWLNSYDTSMYGYTFPITSGTDTMTIGSNWNSPGYDMSILLNDTCIRSVDGTTTYWEPVL